MNKFLNKLSLFALIFFSLNLSLDASLRKKLDRRKNIPGSLFTGKRGRNLVRPKLYSYGQLENGEVVVPVLGETKKGDPKFYFKAINIGTFKDTREINQQTEVVKEIESFISSLQDIQYVKLKEKFVSMLYRGKEYEKVLIQTYKYNVNDIPVLNDIANMTVESIKFATNADLGQVFLKVTYFTLFEDIEFDALKKRSNGSEFVSIYKETVGFPQKVLSIEVKSKNSLFQGFGYFSKYRKLNLLEFDIDTSEYRANNTLWGGSKKNLVMTLGATAIIAGGIATAIYFAPEVAPIIFETEKIIDESQCFERILENVIEKIVEVPVERIVEKVIEVPASCDLLTERLNLCVSTLNKI